MDETRPTLLLQADIAEPGLGFNRIYSCLILFLVIFKDDKSGFIS